MGGAEVRRADLVWILAADGLSVSGVGTGGVFFFRRVPGKTHPPPFAGSDFGRSRKPQVLRPRRWKSKNIHTHDQTRKKKYVRWASK